jgi:hypothetical protein
MGLTIAADALPFRADLDGSEGERESRVSAGGLMLLHAVGHFAELAHHVRPDEREGDHDGHGHDEQQDHTRVVGRWMRRRRCACPRE